MSHRTVITSNLATIFADPNVRGQMTPGECEDVDEILKCEAYTPFQVGKLAEIAVRVYRRPDGD